MSAACESKQIMVAPPAFEVNVSKESFKFNAAHFVAYKGFRERLHGHNYRVAVRLLGNHKIGPDGYVIDFGCIKKVTKDICKEMNEHFLCPMRSDVIDITVEDSDESNRSSVTLKCEDGAVFVFPKSDCYMLPIVHATTEELAVYLWGKILERLDSDHLLKRGIHIMEVTVAEAVGQEAVFRMAVPDSEASRDEREKLHDVATYITKGDIVPMPCPAAPDFKPKEKKRKISDKNISDCIDGCKGCKSKMSEKLEALAAALNSGHLKDFKHVGVLDLEKVLNEK